MAKAPRNCLMGFFNDPNDLMEAAYAATDAGFRKCDGYMPFPVHGIEEALNIRRSWIPKVVFFMFLVGAFLGFLLQTWTHSFDWPINVGGKPYFAWPAYVVIIFECAILCAALTNFFSMFVALRLFPNPLPKVIDEGFTDDRFALIIPIKNPDEEITANKLLQRVGADEIRKY